MYYSICLGDPESATVFSASKSTSFNCLMESYYLSWIQLNLVLSRNDKTRYEKNQHISITVNSHWTKNNQKASRFLSSFHCNKSFRVINSKVTRLYKLITTIVTIVAVIANELVNVELRWSSCYRWLSLENIIWPCFGHNWTAKPLFVVGKISLILIKLYVYNKLHLPNIIKCSASLIIMVSEYITRW